MPNRRNTPSPSPHHCRPSNVIRGKSSQLQIGKAAPDKTSFAYNLNGKEFLFDADLVEGGENTSLVWCSERYSIEL
jgi:hypothetical protein